MCITKDSGIATGACNTRTTDVRTVYVWGFIRLSFCPLLSHESGFKFCVDTVYVTPTSQVPTAAVCHRRSSDGVTVSRVQGPHRYM